MKQALIVGFIFLVVLIGFYIIKNNTKSKQMVVVMDGEVDNEYTKRGLKEFSSNFDFEWIEPFQNNILKEKANIKGIDFIQEAKKAYERTKGNKNKECKITFEIEYKGAAYNVYCIIEWDDVMGGIIRLYSENDGVVDLLEDVWVKTTEALGV